MSNAQLDRRSQEGVIVSSSGGVRINILRREQALGIALAAFDQQGRWQPFLSIAPGEDLLISPEVGPAQPLTFSTFQPMLRQGQTVGAMLQGFTEHARVTLALDSGETGPWCRLRIVLNRPSACGRLTLRWRLAPWATAADLCWPRHAVSGKPLMTNPAAMLQAGAHFVALVPDLEAVDAEASTISLSGDPPVIEYSVAISSPAVSTTLACALCIDAHAPLGRGFQQVVRWLGGQEALIFPGALCPEGSATPLPPLPEAPATEWKPFRHEGTPVEIAALVTRLLARADADYIAQEDGLCWLDRLCFHQQTAFVPGGTPVGRVGDGAAWEEVACRLPALLLRAFRLSGNPEYAARARAALGALPPDRQSSALSGLGTWEQAYLSGIRAIY